MGIDILKANTDNYEESQNDGFGWTNIEHRDEDPYSVDDEVNRGKEKL